MNSIVHAFGVEFDAVEAGSASSSLLGLCPRAPRQRSGGCLTTWLCTCMASDAIFLRGLREGSTGRNSQTLMSTCLNDLSLCFLS